MGAKDYLEQILKSHVLPWIQINFSNNEDVVLMQDGASCHPAKSVQNWLKENINFWPKDVWPPSSPDLNPLDFSLWVYVQSKACDHQHPNIGNLKSAVSVAWSNMEASYVRLKCSRFRCRVKAVIKSEGGYID